MSTMNWTISHLTPSITEHPFFRKPRFNWGVTAAKNVYADPDLDWPDPDLPEEPLLLYTIPEDWSTHLPQFDGKSPADFWDPEKEEFIEDGPPELKAFRGIKTFVKMAMQNQETGEILSTDEFQKRYPDFPKSH